MLRISRLTDYSTVIMAYLAAHPLQAHKAKDIAEYTGITLPTVSKLLKMLSRAGLLLAQRGANGGYRLAAPAHTISLAQIIHAMEGDIALTECGHRHDICTMASLCAIRSNWRIINDMLRETLQEISLAAMTKPITTAQFKAKSKFYDTNGIKHAN